MNSANSNLRFAVMSLLALAMFSALTALGVWQVHRLASKEDLIRTMESRIHQPARPLETWYKTEPGTDYWPVWVEGTFRHTGERHFFSTWEGQSGYDIITPLETTPGYFVFVNRGFVPFDRKEPAARLAGQVTGRVKVTGLARSVLAKKPSWLVPDNDPDKNIFYWKDFATMRSSAGLPASASVAELIIDADGTPNPGGLPIGGVTILNPPNSHLQYAVTWFGLSGVLAVIWLILAVRHVRQRGLTARH